MPSASGDSFIQSRIAGSLWGLACGNVLGLEAEGGSLARARRLLGESGPIPCRPVWEATEPWDDDLAMAAELATWIVDGEAPDAGRLLARYLAWWRLNGRGIGAQTDAVLRRAASLRGFPPFTAASELWASRSQAGGPLPQGNGGVMRVAPVGLAFGSEPTQVLRAARLDASLTHWDPVCQDASALVALWVAALVEGAAEPFAWSKARFDGPIHVEVAAAATPPTLAEIEAAGVDGPDLGHCLLTLRIAAAVLASGLVFEDGLLWTLRLGGDTDTNGAVVGALLGARDGLDAVPDDWRACVANPERLDALAAGLARVRAGI